MAESAPQNLTLCHATGLGDRNEIGTDLLALPGLVECHTHLVFAGERAAEFHLRNAGRSYAEILQEGHGLLSTVAATRAASEDALVARYCELVGRDGVPDLNYYKAFSLFRLAAIAQGVYKRSIDGNASSTEASMFGAAVPHLAGIVPDGILPKSMLSSGS